MSASIVGLSFWMNDSNVDAPIRSPAAANIVLGLTPRSCLTAPASTAAPDPPVVVSFWMRPWKSLVARIWMLTGLELAASTVMVNVVVVVIAVGVVASVTVAVTA